LLTILVVTRTIELPLSAGQVQSLCLKAAVLNYVLWPWMGARGEVPATLAEGQVIDARIYLLGVIPAWRHRIHLVTVRDGEIFTNESGGPARRWDHRLTFEPTSPTSCRYTDRVDVEGLGVGTFANLIFRWRHRRWRRLAEILA
jgi:hypothetical protein